MHVNWKNVSHLVAAMVGTIVPGVAAAEQAAWTIHDVTGAQRQDAVLTMANNAVIAVDQIAGKEIIKSDEAAQATRAVIDAVVHLHNVVAKTAAPASAAGV